MRKLKSTSLGLCVKFQILARPTYEEAYSLAKKVDSNFRARQIVKARESILGGISPEELDIYFPAVDPTGSLILGSYDQVSAYLKKYLQLGVSNFIIPNLHDDNLLHCNEVFRRV